MVYKIFLISLCALTGLLHLLRITYLLFRPGFLTRINFIAKEKPDRYDLLLYYLAMLYIVTEVILHQYGYHW
jgi:hypothetical protein